MGIPVFRDPDTTMHDLRAFALFDGIDESQMAPFWDRCRLSTYDAGEMIIDHKEPSHDVRFILQGTVRIVVRMLEGREVIFNDLDSGTFFGELSAIDGGPRSANVTALTRVKIGVMPQAVFEEMCRSVPELSWRVMGQLAGMVRNLSDRLSEFSFLKAKHRLYAVLLRLSKERIVAGERNGTQRIISPSPRQSDIADRISSRREIVSREMKELERMGIMERTRGGLVILKPDLLSNLAAEGWLS